MIFHTYVKIETFASVVLFQTFTLHLAKTLFSPSDQAQALSLPRNLPWAFLTLPSLNPAERDLRKRMLLLHELSAAHGPVLEDLVKCLSLTGL